MTIALQRDPDGNLYALPPELLYGSLYACTTCNGQWCADEGIVLCPVCQTPTMKVIESLIKLDDSNL